MEGLAAPINFCIDPQDSFTKTLGRLGGINPKGRQHAQP
jgi:hypothetical protein